MVNQLNLPHDALDEIRDFIVLIEVGVVTQSSSSGKQITWLDGHREESVAFEQAPPEFAAFKPGQWFEAVVQREPGAYTLQKLTFVRTTEPLREMTQSEFEQWMEKLPTGDHLPESSTKWETL